MTSDPVVSDAHVRGAGTASRTPHSSKVSRTADATSASGRSDAARVPRTGQSVPGETIHVHFTPETPGTYAIVCSQLCGLGHYRMSATLRVLAEPEFAAWLAARETAQESAR